LPALRSLEFAAGYGRVTRHLRKVVPEAEVLACDIHPDAITFVREELSTSTVTSAKLPEEFDLGQFDVVFILSFFSHLPQLSWRRWLLALAAHTAADGLLIFTTHGHRSRLNLGNPTIGTDGFWFKPESEQQDLPCVTSTEVASHCRTTSSTNALEFLTCGLCGSKKAFGGVIKTCTS
jgi:SAM-dependent methyltransferase